MKHEHLRTDDFSQWPCSLWVGLWTLRQHMPYVYVWSWWGFLRVGLYSCPRVFLSPRFWYILYINIWYDIHIIYIGTYCICGRSYFHTFIIVSYWYARLSLIGNNPMGKSQCAMIWCYMRANGNAKCGMGTKSQSESRNNVDVNLLQF